MRKETDLDQPLNIKINGGLLQITIGLNRLEGNECHPSIPCLKIHDHKMWGADIARELCREEDGSSPLGDLFDKCIQNAIDMGSTAFNQRDYEKNLSAKHNIKKEKNE